MRTTTLRVASFALLATLALTPGSPALAQEGCTGEPDAYRLRATIPLAEAMPEQRGPWPRIFQENSVELVYAPGQKVLLAGDAQGLRTDDVVAIDVAPSGQHWGHDFRDAAHTRIVPLTAAPDLTTMFVAGSNQVTITLKDLLGPVYSTSVYAVQIWEPCAALAVTPAATATPDVSAAGPGADNGTPGETGVSLDAASPPPVSEGGAPVQGAVAAQTATDQTPIEATIEALLHESAGATPGRVAVVIAPAAALPSAAPVAQNALPTPPVPVIAAVVTQTVDGGLAPAGQAPANTALLPPKRRPVWPFFTVVGLIFSAVWYRKRHPEQWNERMTQLSHFADETMHMAREQALMLWQKYAAERYAQLMKLIEGSKDNMPR